MYQSYLQSRKDTSDAGKEHPSHTSLDVEMPERLTHTGNWRFVTTGIQVETTTLQGTKQSVQSPWGREGGETGAKGRRDF
jgi:hypothetical protein